MAASTTATPILNLRMAASACASVCAKCTLCIPRDESFMVSRNSSSLVSTSTSTARVPTLIAAETFWGSSAGMRPVPSLMIAEPFSDVSMMICSVMGRSTFALVSFADLARVMSRICCVAFSTSRSRASAVTLPRTTWKTSLSPTSASSPASALPAIRMPRVSGERFLASRNASSPLIPGRFWAVTMTSMGVSTSVLRASLPLVAQCTVYSSPNPELSCSRVLSSLCISSTCVLNSSRGNRLLQSIMFNRRRCTRVRTV